MSDALIEYGIGETRAVVLGDGGAIVEAHIERDGGWRAGDVREVRLATIITPGVRGIVGIGDIEALIEPLPRALTEGMTLRVEVMRKALAEAGRVRLAKVVATTAAVGSGPSLTDRLRSRGIAARETSRHGPDELETAGWSELVEAALTGHVAFAGGSLTISPTPAMTVIDVDGVLPPVDLALAAADAVGHAISLFDLTGSIGIDFPTVADKAARAAIGVRLDESLPPPFERTAVNGFGFAQVVRPRLRASFVEVLRAERAATAALRLLRLAERGLPGRCTLVAGPVVIAWLDARPALVAELGRRIGGTVALQADASLPTSGYVAP